MKRWEAVLVHVTTENRWSRETWVRVHAENQEAAAGLAKRKYRKAMLLDAATFCAVISIAELGASKLRKEEATWSTSS